MPSLREVQVALSAAIRSADHEGLRDLVRDDGIPPERRVQIYRNNFRLNALAAMRATYPVIERLAGADWFAQSVGKFQETYPSQSGDLQNLGAAYPQFLHRELADTEYRYFADVAELEWCYQLVLTAGERGPVDIDKLRSTPERDYEKLRFVPRPALALVESVFPILGIWRANQPSSPSAAPMHLDSGASRVLLIRRETHVELRELAIGAYELLRQFRLGMPLGMAVAAAEVRAPQFDLSTTLHELLSIGTIADITSCQPRDHFGTDSYREFS